MTEIQRILQSVTQLSPEVCSRIPDNIFELLNTDSRTIKEGQWFLPFKGESFDGHKYIETALEQGASGFFYSDDKYQNLENGIKVSDTREFYGQLATAWRRIHDFKIIAVTGSSGKTTYKELLSLFLEEHGIIYKTRKNFNNEIGVPLTILETPKTADYLILEMGARHVGDLKYLSKIAEQNVSVVLNVGNAHIGEFGSFSNLVKTKCEIIKFGPRDSIGIVNADQSEILDELSDDTHRKIYFSTEQNGDVHLISDSEDYILYKINEKEVKVRIPYQHVAFAPNISAILATLLALEIELDKEYRCLSEFSGLEGRFKVLKLSKKTIVDDCYNANLDSMKVGLSSFKKGFDLEKSTLIIGDMLELGEDSKKYHLEIGRYIHELSEKIGSIVTIGTDSKEISDYLSQLNYKTRHFDTVDEYIKIVETLSPSNDILYLKGSNGIKLSKIIDYYS